MAYSLIRPISHAAQALSLIAGLCAAAASVATLLSGSAFPAPPGASGVNVALAEARGWSLVTLVIALPLLAICLLGARKGASRSAQLGWLGTLAYLVYTYLELAVSPPFSALYLLYVCAFACAIPALVLGAAAADRELEPTLAPGLPRRAVATFALTSAGFLSLAWLKGILAQTSAGAFGWPSGVDAIGHVVHALDLGLQAPLGIATGVLLLRRKPAGLVVAAIFLVNSICMGLALTAMVVSSALAAGSSAFAGAPFGLIAIVATALSVRFFQAVELPGGARRPASRHS
jgi:hypothetical protein